MGGDVVADRAAGAEGVEARPPAALPSPSVQPTDRAPERLNLTTIAGTMIDTLVASGHDLESVAAIGTLVRSEAWRRMAGTPKKPLVGVKLPNVRPDLIGTDPDHPPMFKAGPEPGAATEGGLYRGLAQPQPEEPSNGTEAQEYRVDDI